MPTPPPSPPEGVVYGPAPRSHADEVRARIAAEHEAARARREANPEPAPVFGARYGSRCPICLEEWDVNAPGMLRVCCCRKVCRSCADKIGTGACPLCRLPCPETEAEALAQLRRHVENEVPEAIVHLGHAYRDGIHGIAINAKKAAKLYKRAAELGNVEAVGCLGALYIQGPPGVKLDKRKGMHFLRMSADGGYAKGQHALALLLPKGGEEQLRYVKLAAEQGLTNAEYSLGFLSLENDWNGLEEGKRWLRRAAAKGHERAIGALKVLAENRPGLGMNA